MEFNFDQASTDEMAVFENFKTKYIKQFPMPEKASVKMMQTIGWQFIVVLIQSFGAILLASLRTAEMFYIAASGSNPGLRFVEAVSAVLAIEFGVVVYAAIRAEGDNRKATDEERQQSIKVSLKILIVGELLGILISVIAGLGISFRGFGVDIVWFKWVLSGVIGAGASIIAAVSGDILGAMLARFGNIRDNLSSTHASDMEKWNTSLNTAWAASPERKIVRDKINQILDLQKMERQDLLSQHPVRSPRVRSANDRTNEQNERTEQVSPQAQRIFDYLDQNSTPTSIPGPTAISRALGVAKGYASDQTKIWRAMRNWPASAQVSDVGEEPPQSLEVPMETSLNAAD